jgi:hypothetical protein
VAEGLFSLCSSSLIDFDLGAGELKDLYIQWYHSQIGPDAVHLLTYTHEALKAHQVKSLVAQAYRFAQERN